MLRSSLPVLLALLALSGCSAFGPSASDVMFEAAATEYAPGKEVTARLKNGSDSSVGYNLCYSDLEVRGDTWERVDPTTLESRVCLDILYGLEAGGMAETTVTLPNDLLAGDYRLATTIELENGESVEVTAPFEVR